MTTGEDTLPTGDDSPPSSAACCSPHRPSPAGTDPATQEPPTQPTTAQHPTAAGAPPVLDLVDIPGGEFVMGSDEEQRWPSDGEAPARIVDVDGFRIGRCAVSNDEFAAFVDATGYETDAERFGWSFVFAGLLPDEFGPTRGVAAAPWWRQIEGADWRHPFGPQSSLDGWGDHPVVHVSLDDAFTFCAWAGVRLPTEAEWERAARGGLEQARYPWGDDLRPDGVTMCNIFEGEFPVHNTAADGYAATAPVAAFPANGFGLHNAVGNVWEWCGDVFDGAPGHHVIRGGSYLCHDSYCDRYRVSARSSNSADSSTGNMGFRVAAGR